MAHVGRLKYTAESRHIVESNHLIEACREQDIIAERLFREREILLEESGHQSPSVTFPAAVSDTAGNTASITSYEGLRRAALSASMASTRLFGRMSVQFVSIQSRHSFRLPLGPTAVHPFGISRNEGHNEY